ncbi:heavy-metal-associated domain-containing protein [Cryobacterium sp. TMT3-29-2]|uniref:heavy-metal-associated domain-containing protein n=1 Tax=Cryobacterium sp. TMT3-29-2 TaxID=2555867 RepID=UPI0010744674|nr:cation transporter [Cryobacterium sp. TMT3-29-2]TFC84142.1 copper chaperone [Cryobacterium sp. TMT3-29-2]
MTTPTPSPSPSSLTEEFQVTGMTCQHCVGSVVAALGKLASVEAVTVDLNSGGASTVRVTSAAALDRATVGSAVTTAGYQLA